MYYWHIKRYKEDPIKVKPKAGQAALEAWTRAKQLGKEEIIALPNGGSISTSSISSIEPSTDVVEDDNIYKLTGGEEVKSYGNGRPVIMPDYEEGGVKYQGEVMCNWYKKNIDRREWENYYCKIPSYFRLDAPDRSLWVAFLLAEEENSRKPAYLEQCTEEESKYLYERRNSNH